MIKIDQNWSKSDQMAKSRFLAQKSVIYGLAAECDQIWTKSDQKSQNVTKRHKIWSKMIKIDRNVIKMWPNSQIAQKVGFWPSTVQPGPLMAYFNSPKSQA